ncbi:Nitric oxide oxidoreductase [Oleoguttula sp. CCFEE 5521]
MSLTRAQIDIVRSTAPILQEHGTAITSEFYGSMLKDVPELNNIFNQASQATGRQSTALAGALFAYATHIDDLGALSPAVEKICQKHASLYVQPQHYEVVGTYLLRAMGTILGAALTLDILEAWKVAYWQLANIMIKTEAQISEKTDEWRDWRQFRIARKVPESSEITSFYLKPCDGEALPAFLPGQYTSVKTEVPRLDYSQARQYSLSDAPNPSYYRISVSRHYGLQVNDSNAREHPGYISNVLHDDQKEGDLLAVSCPAGEFYLDVASPSTAPVVLICSGVGVTPMMSMLNSLLARQATRRISFIHRARSTAVRAFGDDIAAAAKKHANVSSVVFIGTPVAGEDIHGMHYHYAGNADLGVLDKERDLCLDDERAEYFVCGTETFMRRMGESLKGLGVEQERIKMEVFGTGPTPL